MCPNLCDPIVGSPPGSAVPGILQERTLEWVDISFSNAWKWKVKVKSLSRVWLLPTPWTAAYQAPPSMGFSRQEDWSGVPLSPPYTNLGRSINKLLILSCPDLHTEKHGGSITSNAFSLFSPSVQGFIFPLSSFEISAYTNRLACLLIQIRNWNSPV